MLVISFFVNEYIFPMHNNFFFLVSSQNRTWLFLLTELTEIILFPMTLRNI